MAISIIVIQFFVIICLIAAKVKETRQLREIEVLLDDVLQGNVDRRIIMKQNSPLAGLSFKINGIIAQSKQAAQDKRMMERENSQLLTSLSHDVKTPLTSIIGYLDALYYQYANQELHEEFITTIREKAYLLKKYIDQLFLWFKLNAKEQKMEPARIDIIETSKRILANWIAVFEKEGLSYDFETECECLYLWLDENIYERILHNLIQNVVEHGEAARIRVAVAKKEDQIQIIVEDDGKGIPAKDLAYIFDRLYKCDAARGDRGSGLGLAIVKKLTDLAGGRISVESEEGVGTRFIVEMAKDISCVCI